MRIQRLYIGDFGILRNQVLEDVNPGIVVIGGLNRAGKSTFMQVLKYLGFGFPTGKGLPPASGKYEVEADIGLNIGDTYNLRLSGYAQPSIRRISGADTEFASAQDIFELDDFTYQRLFIITLDELNRSMAVPSQEKRKLQSILLGAGFSDMLFIPRLEKDFASEADKIGGKRGDPSVKLFKNHYNDIEDGRILKQKGLSCVLEYQKKQQELKNNEDLLKSLTEEIEDLNNGVIRLDVIKNNHENYRRMTDLKNELEIKNEERWDEAPDKYHLNTIIELQDRYKDLSEEISDKKIGLDIADETRDLLLGQREEIAGLTAAASGAEERIDSYGSRIKEYDDKKQSLARTIRGTNSQWDESHIQFIQSINTDGIEHGSLAILVERHRETGQSLKNRTDSKKVLEKEYEELRGSHENIGKSPLLSGLKKYLYIFIISALLGGILSIFNPTLGILIGAGGIGGAILYIVLNFLDSKESKGAISQREDLIKTKAASILEEDNAIKELKSELESLEEKLDGYRKAFGLPDGVYYSVLPNHLLRIRDIQEKVDELQRMRREMAKTRKRIDSDFLRYGTFISQFDGDPVDDTPIWENDRKGVWKEILSRLKLWGGLLKQSEDLEILEQKREAVREEMIEIMGEVDLDNKDFDLLAAEFIDRSEKAIEYRNKENALVDIQRALLNTMASDRIRDAFGMISDQEGDSSRNDGILDLFEEQCRAYTSTWEAEEAYREVSGDHNRKLSERDSIKEKIQGLKIEIKQLASPEDLTRGQRQIDAGRARLEALAKDYAVNKIASFLLKETEKNLLEGMKDSIMGSAGTIFRNMTGGEYKGILPSEPILDSDFQAVMGEGTDSQTIEMLSRGTREQLYLSVRLSRIMDIKPCLPIIIDDSFANFDSAHLMQSIKILSELSKTHQIFILTCHSQLVDGINKCGCESQYWLLDEGKLSISDHEDLTRHLCRVGL